MAKAILATKPVDYEADFLSDRLFITDDRADFRSFVFISMYQSVGPSGEARPKTAPQLLAGN